MSAMALRWRSEDNFVGSVISFCYRSRRNQSKVARFLQFYLPKSGSSGVPRVIRKSPVMEINEMSMLI